MEYIETEIAPVKVEIEGETYAVAAKTVAVAEALLAAQKKAADKPEYVLWLAEMEILLGRGAVKKLFHRGKKENIDRMQQIYEGVCRAFERNAERIERERAERKAGALEEIAGVVEPGNELRRQLARLEEGGARTIRRGDV